MRISDWSSDVCSSDLAAAANILPVQAGVCQYITRKVFTGRAAEIVSHKQVRIENQVAVGRMEGQDPTGRHGSGEIRCRQIHVQIGRASGRERVGKYV